MERTENLSLPIKFAALLPLCSIAFLVTFITEMKIKFIQYPTTIFEFLTSYAFPICFSIGIFSHIIWFYRAYKASYRVADVISFYPSLATLLAHTPILAWISMPICLREIWHHLAKKPNPWLLKAFLIWWITSIVVILSLIINKKDILVFWTSSLMLSIVWIYLIIHKITASYNEDISYETTI